MCSVFGYIGKQYSRRLVMEGLSKLEYRGYDSAGFACLDTENHRLAYVKATGDLNQLKNKIEQQPIDGFISIGHTRWATHGGSAVENAHPHFDCEKNIALIHNGIIENHHELRQALLQQGHVFHSQTDTEVAAHVLERAIAAHGLSAQVLASVFTQLEGAYAFVAILQNYADTMIVARKRSPLCLGVGHDEFFVSSDPLAFIDKTKEVLFMPDESFALISPRGIELYTFAGVPVPPVVTSLSISTQEYDKQQHQHFMLKEIYEQKRAIQDTLAHLKSLEGDLLWQQLGISAEYAAQLQKISLIGCGTSWYAGRIAQFFFEQVSKVPTQVSVASEFRHMPFFAHERGLCIAITQSGETADTLEAIRLVRSCGMKTVGLTNAPSSSIIRETDGQIITKAGPEVAVASTKAFVTQLTVLYWLSHRVALSKGLISAESISRQR